ncbi:MAG TPA: hemerythrin family protein [Anaeromyxobacteraceae bacterium]|jgi:hemerythrin-like metal-binding protein
MARTWNAKLSVGVALIDNQHRELFDRGDLLAEALRGARPAAELMRLAQYLESWVAIHFDAEERLMQVHRHPGYQEHRAAHGDFRDRLAQVKERVRCGGGSAAEAEAVEALMAWLVDHVRAADAPVAELVLERQPRPRHPF